jgi:hypothetical protein
MSDGSLSSDERPPTFAYTVGLFGLGHPELVALGTDQGTALGMAASGHR